MDTRLVILGAGAPHRGVTPSALREPCAGVSTLEWLLNATNCSPSQATFVAGYQSDLISDKHPDINFVINADWRESASGASLLAAVTHADSPLLVCYSDILFRSDIVESLNSLESDVVFAWDSSWTRRYSGRSQDDLDNCEKVIVTQEETQRLGSDIPTEWATGEFIGLVRLSPACLSHLLTLRSSLRSRLRKLHLSDFVEYLRLSGFSLGCVDIHGDWAELNEPKDIAHFVLGTKAETLSRLQPVLRSAIIQDQVIFSISEWEINSLQLLQHIRNSFPGQTLVVRSCSNKEDSFTLSYAGVYTSHVNVEPDEQLVASIHDVIASYDEYSGDNHVLIQPMVHNVELTGVAFTRTLEHGAPWYVINYVLNGDTTAITAGSSQEHETLVFRRDLAPDKLRDFRIRAIYESLLEIQTLLGYDSLDIEFAIDVTSTVHIFQVRPITGNSKSLSLPDSTYLAHQLQTHSTWKTNYNSLPHIPGNAPPLFGVMPDWNPAEIIGTSPGLLASSLYRFLVTDEVWATQRAEFGYRDVRPSPLLVDFGGTPYVDVRASLSSFIPAGLDESTASKLLVFYLERLKQNPQFHDKIEFDVLPTCLTEDFPKWHKLLTNNGVCSLAEVDSLRESLLILTSQAFTRPNKHLLDIQALAQRYDIIAADKTLEPLVRARHLLYDCRRLGTLPFAHLARCAFISVALLKASVTNGTLSSSAYESFLTSLRTVSHNFTHDAYLTSIGSLNLHQFVARYGHLRPGTYEIQSPRYDSDPDTFLYPVIENSSSLPLDEPNLQPWLTELPRFLESLSNLGLPSSTDLVTSFLRNSIEGREYAKFVFTRNLSEALECIAQAGLELGISRELLSNISISTLIDITYRTSSPADIAEFLTQCSRRSTASQQVASTSLLPPLLTCESDLDVFLLHPDLPNYIGSKCIIAPSIDLTQSVSSSNSHITGKIILLAQADPGYDWIFAHGISGLITLFGGANSHMAIRCAEFGIPAAIGVGHHSFSRLSAAQIIEISPANQTVRVIS